MNLLSIGGSDPSSGAGIQSDLRMFSSNVHWLTVITAVTAQNTSKFGMVEQVSEKILKSQLQSIISDFKIAGIKIGMVYDSQIIKTIYQQLIKLKIPIVVDPVIKSTTGGELLKKSAIKDYQKYIIPLATVITPNKYEAEILSKTKINSKIMPEKSAKKIQIMGAKNVSITGIQTQGGKISDFVLEKNKKYFISGGKISKINHGSGGNYSSAVLFSLAKNKSVKESLRFAKQYTYDSIKNAKKVGKGIVITDIYKKDSIKTELSESIQKFIEIKDIYFSGFSSQGDGACFEGNYSYEKQSLKNIKAYAPLDEDLHNIAKELQKIQRKNFYGLWANVKHSGHYYHEMSTNIQVGSDNESMGGANDEAHEGIQEILRSFMQWMYSRLEKEHDYLTSEEAIKESIIANEVEFNEDGSNHY